MTSALHALSAPPALDADALVDAATALAGLSDFGDETLLRRLTQAVGHLQAFNLEPAAKAAAAFNALRLLTARLQFFEDFKRYPIAAEQIERPLFATGEPRSGTTLLHALLSVDPNARALRFWEVMYPSPPPGVAKPDDPRRAQADADWRAMLRDVPEWLVSHPYNDMLGDGLPECERTWAWDFRMLQPSVWWRVPIGVVSVEAPDDAAIYRLHKMMLQHGQYARPKKRWALKGFHGARLAALFETYPDARIIWTHRDPVQVIASKIAVVGGLITANGGKVDPQKLAAQMLESTRANIRTLMTDPRVADPRVHHVRFRDVMKDPANTLRSFYEASDRSFDPEFEANIHSYLASNRSDRYGKFVYSTDAIGADVGALNAEFSDYRERFGIEIEHR
jgi:hypothetical protein